MSCSDINHSALEGIPGKSCRHSYVIPKFAIIKKPELAVVPRLKGEGRGGSVICDELSNETILCFVCVYMTDTGVFSPSTSIAVIGAEGWSSTFFIAMVSANIMDFV